MQGEVTDSVKLYVETAMRETSKQLLSTMESRISPLAESIRKLEDSNLERKITNGWWKILGRVLTGAAGGSILYVLQHYLHW